MLSSLPKQNRSYRSIRSRVNANPRGATSVFDVYWGSWIRTNEMTESKSVALPLGYTPRSGFLVSRTTVPDVGLAMRAYRFVRDDQEQWRLAGSNR